jgi:transcriptional regulator with XRE-family HTH domain
MPTRKLRNYLRTYRRRSGFSQTEVAFLLGCRSGSKVSRYEHFARQPDFLTVCACAVIFHASGRDMFSGTFQQVERETRERAQLLLRKLEQAKPSALTSQKLKALQAILSASETNPTSKV